MRTLYWFQNDLRLQDNPGLNEQLRASGLLLVYFMPLTRPWCNSTGSGIQRERFLLESLQALQSELAEFGQKLLILDGPPEQTIPKLVRDHQIDRVATSQPPGYYERKTRQLLRSRLSIPMQTYNTSSLFDTEDLPFHIDELPATFTAFRRAVEGLNVLPATGTPAAIPPPLTLDYPQVRQVQTKPHLALPVRGGSENAQRRLNQFIFNDRSIERYKQTRNCLDGFDGSSTLSPWLANGGISARQIMTAVRQFEKQQVKNDSTYWLFFELLWREYFHWRAVQDDVNLFRLRPAKGQKRLHNCTFEPRSFARWCSGSTDFPLVNALMRQLVATGWMSNRGRQITASCLINELGIDWRYGAAFFEKHLLDFDVASNYGNWQYLAGVGADPRGGRHFNLDKQTREYDPQGAFIAKWQGNQPKQPEHVTDAADWPIIDA